MNEQEMIQKEIRRLEKEIQSFRNKISNSHTGINWFGSVLNQITNTKQRMENSYSEALNNAKRKSAELSSNNKFGTKYIEELDKIFRTDGQAVIEEINALASNVHRGVDEEDNSIKGYEREIRNREQQISILRQELRNLSQ